MQTLAKLPHSRPIRTANAYAPTDVARTSNSGGTSALTVARLTRPVDGAKTSRMFRGGRLGLVLSLVAACGRAQGVPDEELGDLVVETRTGEPPIGGARAATTAAQLGRALRQPYAKVIAAIGPHTLAISSVTSVGEG